jgi:hypothetical protein
LITFNDIYTQSVHSQPISEDYKQSLETLWNTGIEVLSKLYKDQAQDVIQACHDVSARFCLHVVCVVYGVHWFLDQPLSIDKAYMTTVALMLEGQWNQFKVLKQTFLNEAAKKQIDGQSILRATAKYLLNKQWINAEKLTSIQTILGNKSTQTKLDNLTLEKCHLAVLATLQLQRNELDVIKILNPSNVKQLLFHLNTYIGCPRVWNASIQFD